MSAKKSKLNRSLYNGEIDKRMVEKARHKMQLNAYHDILSKLVQREPYVDYETEVLPFLSEKHKYIFENYMINPTGEYQFEMAEKLNYSDPTGVFRAIEDIFEFIDNVIVLKEKRKAYIKSFGGREKFEDLVLCLPENFKEALYSVMLSINPNAASIYNENHKTNNSATISKHVDYRLKLLEQRKKDCEKFIKDNGGEDFLVNEFGMTLSEDHFNILINFMMDYHYTSDTDVSLEMGVSPNHLLYVKKSIIQKLAEYNERKNQVDALIESAGGTEKVLNEIYLKLNETEKTVFEERILAYSPTYQKELGQKIGLEKWQVASIEEKLRAKLDTMVNANNPKKD